MTDDSRPDDPGEYEGVYFDGRTSKRHPVRVTRVAEGLRVRGESVGDLLWTHAEMRRDLRIAANEPARYERGGDSPEVLVIADPSFLPAVRSVFGGGGTPERRGGSGASRLIIPALAVLAGLIFLYTWSVPRMANAVAARVPVEWEERLGATVASAITSSAPVCSAPAGLAALDKMVGTLTADGRGGPYQYRVTIVDDSLVNALAAPGGEIVVFSGLIAQTSGQDELAGVLAHEIEHVVQQHGVKGILRQIPLQLLMTILTGREGIATSATQLAVTVGGLTYQRRDELEADREGMRLLQAARVEPAGMIGFFRRLSETSGEAPRMVNYLSTHPSSAARMEALSVLAGEAQYEAQPILTDAEWQALRTSCERE